MGQTMNNKDRLTTAASAVLSLYALFEIIQTLILALDANRFIFKSFGQRVFYFLSSSIGSWGLLALGLCGLVLVYAEISKDKDMEFQNQFAKIKKIVFSAFLILTIGSIFKFIYLGYTSYQSYEIAIASGVDRNSLGFSFFAVSIIGAVFGALIIFSRTLFGIYLLNKIEKLIRPIFITSIAGFAYTFISRTYSFVNAIIFNSSLFADASKIVEYGQPENRIGSVIFSYAGDLLVLAASLIIILYGIKKEKIAASEQGQNEEIFLPD
ncbi:MAG: hypothetical protein ACYCYM_11490 [Saccharofermentanales bacterium]